MTKDYVLEVCSLMFCRKCPTDNVFKYLNTSTELLYSLLSLVLYQIVYCRSLVITKIQLACKLGTISSALCPIHSSAQIGTNICCQAGTSLTGLCQLVFGLVSP